MKLLHTADWHLGQTLHGASRSFEHGRFLAWLLCTLEVEEIDALIVAGDVFDSASPPASAQEQYYRFLAECRRRLPKLGIVVVGGNHDSPARLDAPGPVLEAIGVHVVGGFSEVLEAQAQRAASPADRALIPLTDRRGKVGALLLAVPFLRPKDLPGAGETEASASARLVDGHRELYRRLTDVALGRRPNGAALIATGHCYMQGGIISELSERKIQMGNQHALPLDVFPSELAYVALGHLHRAQTAGRDSVRYSGSPIPLSMTERSYEHQVLLVELEGERLQSVRPLFVPRSVELIALPEANLQLSTVLDLLRALPRETPPGKSLDERPFCEVRVWLEEAHPRLRAEIEAAIDGAYARLVRIDVKRPDRRAPEVTLSAPDLEALQPVEVFKAAYARERRKNAPDNLIGLFETLVDDVQKQEPS